MNRTPLFRALALACLFGLPVQPAVADPGQRLQEIRALLREQALVVPGEHRLAALDSGNLREGLRSIDPWADWREGETGGALAAGIGADLYSEAGRHWLMPHAGGALMQAGFLDRVELRGVDGAAVAGLATAAVARMLSGDPGETRRLALCPPGCAASLTLVLELESSRPQSVEHLHVGGRDVIRIRRFVGWETRSFLETLVRSSAHRAPLLLDLRDCQGGDLFEAMDAAALFLPAGAELAAVRGRHGSPSLFRAPGGQKIDTRATLLVSRHTASAGEVFAGILQAHRVARLVGERTRGKCVSQTERMLSDGSILTFTNLAIELPGGVGCQGVGLAPDLVLEPGLVDDLGALLASGRLDGPPAAGN